ncbi:MAG: carboxyltransferase domain-containing protein, partial [Gemmataceae bacterium]|nr:carboxyltransferase domain-containing protein [Gemmataceae bacterium]
GIYPLPRPGGWRLIGRTPLVLVDVAAGYFPLRAGDRVCFQPISEPEYRRLEGRRLPSDPARGVMGGDALSLERSHGQGHR